MSIMFLIESIHVLFIIFVLFFALYMSIMFLIESTHVLFIRNIILSLYINMFIMFIICKSTCVLLMIVFTFA